MEYRWREASVWDVGEMVERARTGEPSTFFMCPGFAGRMWRRAMNRVPPGRGDAAERFWIRQVDAGTREIRSRTRRARLLVDAWRTGHSAAHALLANWRPAHEHAGYVYSLMLVEWPRTRERPPLAVRQALAHGFHPEAPYGVCPLWPHRPRWPYRPPAQKRRI